MEQDWIKVDLLRDRAARSVKSKRAMESLLSLLAGAHSSYGKALIKCASLHEGSAIFAKGWSCLVAGVANIGKQHVMLGRSIKQLCKGLIDFAAKQEAEVGEIGARAEGQFKELESLQRRYSKAMQKYQKSCIEASRAIEARDRVHTARDDDLKELDAEDEEGAPAGPPGMSSPSKNVFAAGMSKMLERVNEGAKAMGKSMGGGDFMVAELEGKVQRWLTRVDTAEQEYITAIMALNGFTAEFPSAMETARQAFNQNEAAAISFLKAFLLGLQQAYSQMLQESKRGTLDAVRDILDNIDPEAEATARVATLHEKLGVKRTMSERTAAGSEVEAWLGEQSDDSLRAACKAFKSWEATGVKCLGSMCSFLSEVASIEAGYAKGLHKILIKHGYLGNSEEGVADLFAQHEVCATAVSNAGSSLRTGWESSVIGVVNCIASRHLALRTTVAERACVGVSKLQERMKHSAKAHSDGYGEICKKLEALKALHTKAAQRFDRICRDERDKQQQLTKAEEELKASMRQKQENVLEQMGLSKGAAQRVRELKSRFKELQDVEKPTAKRTLEESTVNLMHELDAFRNHISVLIAASELTVGERLEQLKIYLCAVAAAEEETCGRLRDDNEAAIPDIEAMDPAAEIAEFALRAGIKPGPAHGESVEAVIFMEYGSVVLQRERQVYATSKFPRNTESDALLKLASRAANDAKLSQSDQAVLAPSPHLQDDIEVATGTAAVDELLESPVLSSSPMDPPGPVHCELDRGIDLPRESDELDDRLEIGSGGESKGIGEVPDKSMAMNSSGEESAAILEDVRDASREQHTVGAYEHDASLRPSVTSLGTWNDNDRLFSDSEHSDSDDDSDRGASHGPSSSEQRMQLDTTAGSEESSEEETAAQAVESYSCALYVNNLPMHGRLTLFPASIRFAGWGSTRIHLPMTKVTHVEKSATLRIVPNALTISTVDGRRLLFGSFLYRDDCYVLLTKLVFISSKLAELAVPGEEPKALAAATKVPVPPCERGLSDGGYVTLLNEDLNCSTEEAFTWLWGPDTTFWVDFLKDQGEQNLIVSDWEDILESSFDGLGGAVFQGDGGQVEAGRTLEFDHPRTSMTFMGPKTVHTTQRQAFWVERDDEGRLWRAVILLTQRMEGVPLSDAFTVGSRIVLSSVNSRTCRQQVGLQVFFHKSTMLKGKIKGGSEAELKVMWGAWRSAARGVTKLLEGGDGIKAPLENLYKRSREGRVAAPLEGSTVVEGEEAVPVPAEPASPPPSRENGFGFWFVIGLAAYIVLRQQWALWQIADNHAAILESLKSIEHSLALANNANRGG